MTMPSAPHVVVKLRIWIASGFRSGWRMQNATASTAASAVTGDINRRSDH